MNKSINYHKKMKHCAIKHKGHMHFSDAVNLQLNKRHSNEDYYKSYSDVKILDVNLFKLDKRKKSYDFMHSQNEPSKITNISSKNNHKKSIDLECHWHEVKKKKMLLKDEISWMLRELSHIHELKHIEIWDSKQDLIEFPAKKAGCDRIDDSFLVSMKDYVIYKF